MEEIIFTHERRFPRSSPISSACLNFIFENFLLFDEMNRIPSSNPKDPKVGDIFSSSI